MVFHWLTMTTTAGKAAVIWTFKVEGADGRNQRLR
jgi:hypothetical protein